MNLVLRDPAYSAGDAKSTVSITPKDQSSFIDDLVANIKLWLRPLALVTAMWVLASTILIIVIVGNPSEFSKAAPKDFWDLVYYVTINLTAGFDDYHPYSLWARLITVANIIFGLAIFGMIVAIFTSSMSPNTEVSVASPQEFVGSVEISQLAAIADAQQRAFKEISSINEKLAAALSTKQATEAEEVNKQLLQEIAALRQIIEVYEGRRENELAPIRGEINRISDIIHEEAYALRRFRWLIWRLGQTDRLLERYFNHEERDRDENNCVREAIHRLADDLNRYAGHLRRG